MLTMKSTVCYSNYTVSKNNKVTMLHDCLLKHKTLYLYKYNFVEIQSKFLQRIAL